MGKTNKRLADAATRLRNTNTVDSDLIPGCGLDVVLERDGKTLVERVYDMETGVILQEIEVPRKMAVEVRA